MPFAQLEYDLESLEPIQDTHEPATMLWPLNDVQRHVLSLFGDGQGYTDSELNAAWEILAPMKGWPRLHPESPRRRRSELAKLGLLVKSGRSRVNEHGGSENEWIRAS